MRIDGIDLSIIDSSGAWDYQWSEFALMRGNDGYLYVGSDAGCSCYCFGDADVLDDFERVSSWQEAAAKAQAWAGEGETDEKRGVMEMIERLMKASPIAFDPDATAS